MANTHQGEISADVEFLSEETPPAGDEKVTDKDTELLLDEESDAEVEEELEEELEEPEEPEEPEETPEKPEDKFPLNTRPALADINKAFPDFFKKFPAMKDVIFREKEFTTLFPSVELAKDASEASEALEDFRADLFTGTGEKFTSALKDAGELNKFSKNFFKNLQATDKEIYWDAITPTLENLVRGAYREGVKRGDKNLQLSAENLSIYLFDTAEVAEGKKTFVKEDPKEDPQVKAEKADWERTKFNNFRIDVLSECSNGLISSIDLSKTQISDKMKAILVKEIVTEVDNLITKDEAHMKHVNSLWSKTKQSGYTNEIKSRIISAYLERAKSLVPSIRRRLLTEALGNTPSEAKRKLEVSERVQGRREPGSSGRSSNGSRVSTPKAKEVNWNKTSDMDFLNDNTTLKGRK